MPTKYEHNYAYSTQECVDNLDSGVANILAMYGKATADEIEKGKHWYTGALVKAEQIASDYSLSLDTVIQVACAISPKCEWDVNMDSAEWIIRFYKSGAWIPDIADYKDGKAYIAHNGKTDRSKPAYADDKRLPNCPYGGLRANFVKALWILSGETWVLRGKKVNSFCSNIKYARQNADVTIDRHAENEWKKVTVDSHAIQAWFGSIVAGTYSVPTRFYAIIQVDYCKAAALVGLTPQQLQAVVWLTKKRLSGQPKRTLKTSVNRK